jgi:UDP-N-acetylmuramoylalanine--D-glutamate ligase
MADVSVAGRTVVVVGAARSGIAAARLLATRGARVTLTDLRPELADRAAEAVLRRAGVALELGAHREGTFSGADLIVLSPGVPLQQPLVAAARQSGVRVVGEIELASWWVRGRIVAITGTKGKSTTTTLAGRMFQAGGLNAVVGGNIGTPLSAQVEESTPDTFHIVEVSSFQLETTDTFHPWIAALLNVSPDHLDRHASVEEYVAAKARVFANQDARDWAVINADDPHALALARRGAGRQLLFALDAPLAEGVCVSAGVVRHRRGGQDVALIPVSSVRLLGRHLLSDVVAAAAVAQLAGVSPAAMVRAVESFTGLEHALEPAGEISGVRFVNDSKATNVEAARRAIESFDDRLVVILGGRFKGGDLGNLRDPLAARTASVVAIGEARPRIHAALDGFVPVREAAGMAAAVRLAFELATPRGTVLLAPACASFDMFADYAERGRLFKQEVRRLDEEMKTTREQ